VASPPKLMVVAVVLSREKVVLFVVRLVVIWGEVPNTNDPLPVSSEITPARADEVVDANCPSVPVVRATSTIAPTLALTLVTPVLEVR